MINPHVRTANYVVAPSNSISKEYADYICDGVADNEEIQDALDNCSENGKVIVLDGHVHIEAPIKLLKKVEFECLGIILPTNNVDGIHLGDNNHEADFSVVKLNGIHSMAESTGRNITFLDAEQCQISYSSLCGGAVGIYFDPVGDAWENRIYGGYIGGADKGIAFSDSPNGMEGTWILSSIFSCRRGVEWAAGGDSFYTHFQGVVDCISVPDSLDFDDNVGGHILTPYFYRPWASNVKPWTVVLSQMNIALPTRSIHYGPLNLPQIGVLTISDGCVTIPTGSFWNVSVEDGETDDLHTINGTVEGDILVLRQGNGVTTIKHNSGNIMCSQDFVLDHWASTITFLNVGGMLMCISKNDNK